MLSLPPFADAGRVWYLPLSADGASLLGACLAASRREEPGKVDVAPGASAGTDGPPAEVRRARRLLRDPPLVLFLTARLWMRGAPVQLQAPTLRRLAQQLSPQTVIDWLAAPRQLPTYRGGNAESLASLAAAATVRARAKATSADAPDSAAVVAELVGDALFWLVSQPETDWPARESRPPVADGWYAWLHQSLLGARTGGTSRSPRSAVRVAKRPALQKAWYPADGAHRQLPELARMSRRCAQLESNFAFALREEKIAALKQFAYGASHEINNPLANIASRAQLLLRDEPDVARRQILGAIERQAFRAHEMIADLMLFANPPDPQYEWLPLDEWIEVALRPCRCEAEAQGTALDVEVSPDLAVSADAGQLSLALQAVVRNALEATQAAHRVRVRALLLDDDNEIVIRVQDDGPGLSTEAQRHAIDPYYSGREAGRGLGFGLPKAYRIMQRHGGRLELTSGPGETTVSLYLPRLPQTQPAQPARTETQG